MKVNLKMIKSMGKVNLYSKKITFMKEIGLMMLLMEKVFIILKGKNIQEFLNMEK